MIHPFYYKNKSYHTMSIISHICYIELGVYIKLQVNMKIVILVMFQYWLVWLSNIHVYTNIILFCTILCFKLFLTYIYVDKLYTINYYNDIYIIDIN